MWCQLEVKSKRRDVKEKHSEPRRKSRKRVRHRPNGTDVNHPFCFSYSLSFRLLPPFLFTLPKQAFPARLSQKLRRKTSKTSVFRSLPKRAFSTRLSQKLRIHNPKRAFSRRLLKNWKILPAYYEHEPCTQATFKAYKKRNFTCIPRLRRARSLQIQKLSRPAFRAFDAHDLRRGLPKAFQKRNFTCIPRPRHARSPQRVVF